MMMQERALRVLRGRARAKMWSNLPASDRADLAGLWTRLDMEQWDVVPMWRERHEDGTTSDHRWDGTDGEPGSLGCPMAPHFWSVMTREVAPSEHEIVDLSGHETYEEAWEALQLYTRCQWYARCENGAETVLDGGPVGPVVACARCADRDARLSRGEAVAAL